MIDDQYYVTMRQTKDGIMWDLRKGDPNGFSVRIAAWTASTWTAATYEAGQALQKYAAEH